jgi:hypothetical protein
MRYPETRTPTRRRGARGLAPLLAAILVAAPAPGVAEETAPGDAGAVLRRLQPAAVGVEVRLRYDRGHAPAALGQHAGVLERLIARDEPLRIPGFAVSANRVWMPDLEVHPRFIESVSVRSGGRLHDARIVAWGTTRDCAFLEVEGPLEPLTFARPPAGPPWTAVRSYYHEGQWGMASWRTLESVNLSEEGDLREHTELHALLLDRNGAPAGVAWADDMPAGASWVGTPLEWPQVDPSGMERLLGELERRAASGILLVHLRLRSPRSTARDDAMGFQRGEEDAFSTEAHAAGVLLDPQTALVLLGLPRSATARLEQISVRDAAGCDTPAAFAWSLDWYDAFVVRLERPAQGPLVPSAGPLRRHRGQLLPTAQVAFHGEARESWFGHARFHSFDSGRRGLLLPSFAGDEASCFVFDREGRLVALPLTERSRRGESRWNRSRPLLVPAEHLWSLVADPAAHGDPSNAPVAAEDEGRMAWLGVELQPLDQELARAKGVSALTDDGQAGGIAAHVYGDSPAAAAGLEPGDILLRLHVPGEGAPYAIQAGEAHGMDPSYFHMVPAEFRAMMPFGTPWPSAQTPLNQQLTQIGFGRRFELEYLRGTETRRASLTVERGPWHFEAAPSWKSEALGITVRDRTYEVDRYFRLAPDAPGVVIAKVEPGGAAAVAGLEPFELITEANGAALRAAQDLAKAAEGVAELRLTVKDRLRERQVKVVAD